MVWVLKEPVHRCWVPTVPHNMFCLRKKKNELLYEKTNNVVVLIWFFMSQSTFFQSYQYGLSAQLNLWSYWVNAQSDLSLRSAHTHSFYWFCHVVAQIICNYWLLSGAGMWKYKLYCKECRSSQDPHCFPFNMWVHNHLSKYEIQNWINFPFNCPFK